MKTNKQAARVAQLLKTKTFDQLLKDGIVLDIEGAAVLTGYSVQHMRYLCANRKVEHFTRGGTQYYFFKDELIAKVFPGAA